jgi:hypothetical protein
MKNFSLFFLNLLITVGLFFNFPNMTLAETFCEKIVDGKKIITNVCERGNTIEKPIEVIKVSCYENCFKVHGNSSYCKEQCKAPSSSIDDYCYKNCIKEGNGKDVCINKCSNPWQRW